MYITNQFFHWVALFEQVLNVCRKNENCKRWSSSKKMCDWVLCLLIVFMVKFQWEHSGRNCLFTILCMTDPILFDLLSFFYDNMVLFLVPTYNAISPLSYNLSYFNFFFPVQFNSNSIKVLIVVLLTCRYKGHRTVSEGLEIDAGLIGHVHLNEVGAFAFNLFITLEYILQLKLLLLAVLRLFFWWVTWDLLNRKCWKIWTLVCMRFFKSAKRLLIYSGRRRKLLVFLKGRLCLSG